MNKLNYTSGPWTNGYGNGICGPTAPSCVGPFCNEFTKYTVVSKEQEVIAIVPEQVDKIFEGNARLIAVAPEMLECLINCYKKFKDYEFDADGDPTFEHKNFMNKNKKIIEKATGIKIEQALEKEW